MTRSRCELERCVAACVLLDGGSIARYVDIPLDDFTVPEARAVLLAAQELAAIDPVIVRSHAEANGLSVKASDVSSLLLVVPTTRNLLHYIVQLKSSIYADKFEALRREMIERGKKENIVELSTEVQHREAELNARYLERQVGADLLQACADMIARIEACTDNERLLPTGVKLVDDMLGGGLLPNELMILAARPSVGKTALALQIALECRRKVVLFSLEMSREQIAPRLLAAISLINTKIATRQPSQVPAELRTRLLAATPELIEAADRVRVIDQHDLNIEAIRRLARREVEAGAELVILDYLQLLDKPNAQSRERAVSQISRELKNMSKELAIPVICLAQMNRAAESENRVPRLSDLRESGAIEQDANTVLFIHRTSTETAGKSREVALILAKGRDVGEGYRKAIFNPDHQRFYALREGGQ